MDILQTKNLYKSYKERSIIKNINIKISSGEIVGLLGHNGSGKTTIFHILTGIIFPDLGKIKINEEDISILPLHIRVKKGITYLPQEPSIFRRMNVFDNLMSILQMRTDLDKKNQKEMLVKLLKKFRIEHLTNVLGESLSGGERRRTEIARALASNPKFVLLDEPFAWIDPISVEEIKKIIQELRDIGIGIFVTDHNVQAIFDICNRIYIFEQGEIILEGTTEEIKFNREIKKKYLGSKT